jgi:hypothetical protein
MSLYCQSPSISNTHTNSCPELAVQINPQFDNLTPSRSLRTTCALKSSFNCENQLASTIKNLRSPLVDCLKFNDTILKIQVRCARIKVYREIWDQCDKFQTILAIIVYLCLLTWFLLFSFLITMDFFCMNFGLMSIHRDSYINKICQTFGVSFMWSSNRI